MLRFRRNGNAYFQGFLYTNVICVILLSGNEENDFYCVTGQ